MCFSLLAALLLFCGCPAPAQTKVASPSQAPESDAVSQQHLTFDAAFAQLTLRYFHDHDPGTLKLLANTPAAAHLLEHARNFDYDVPKDSTQALAAHLMSKETPERVAACRSSLDYFSGPMLADSSWVNGTLAYLPPGFRFRGSLFLIFGYDIGVAYGDNASLNCAHPHFAAHPEELKYYAIHELHHVGFMTYQPPPRLADIKTCRQLLHLVQYSTQLEGMAVYVAYASREKEHALAGDDDYVALQDGARMTRDEQLYFDDLHYLQNRGDEPADDAAWAVVVRMSSGERLWYRVGAHMAQTIEQRSGRTALVALVQQGPEKFLAAYEALVTPRAQPSPPPASPPPPRE